MILYNYILYQGHSSDIGIFPVCFGMALIFTAFQLHIWQECIPVGCVPAAHWPYAAVFFLGVCLVQGGGVLPAKSRGGSPCQVPGGFSLPGLGGVSLTGPGGGFSLPGLGGLPARSWGGSSCQVQGGYGIPACTEADTLPPVDRHTPVKILPWPQLRCSR